MHQHLRPFVLAHHPTCGGLLADGVVRQQERLQLEVARAVTLVISKAEHATQSLEVAVGVFEGLAIERTEVASPPSVLAMTVNRRRNRHMRAA